MIFNSTSKIDDPPLNGAYTIPIQMACPEIQMAFVSMMMGNTIDVSEIDQDHVIDGNISLF